MAQLEKLELNTFALDKIIHERTRLGIMSILSVRADPVAFREIKSLLSLTDGNLNAHMRHLEDANYVMVTKKFVGRKPKTMYGITEQGRIEFQHYVEELESLLQKIRAQQSIPTDTGDF